MKIKKDFVSQFIKDALMSFVYWTVLLTPYMVFVVKMNLSQYFIWVAGGAVLMPISGAVYSILVRKVPFLKESKSRAIQILKDAIVTFVYFTAVFTPYIIFVVGMNLDQYLAWVGMQAILVPPFGIIYTIIIRKIKNKIKLKTTE